MQIWFDTVVLLLKRRQKNKNYVNTPRSLSLSTSNTVTPPILHTAPTTVKSAVFRPPQPGEGGEQHARTTRLKHGKRHSNTSTSTTLSLSLSLDINYGNVPLYYTPTKRLSENCRFSTLLRSQERSAQARRIRLHHDKYHQQHQHQHHRAIRPSLRCKKKSSQWIHRPTGDAFVFHQRSPLSFSANKRARSE